MIKAETYNKVSKMIDEAKKEIEENKNINFVFEGLDEEFIYFTLSCKLSEIQKSEIDYLKHKTRFVFTEEPYNNIFCAKIKMAIL